MIHSIRTLIPLWRPSFIVKKFFRNILHRSSFIL